MALASRDLAEQIDGVCSMRRSVMRAVCPKRDWNLTSMRVRQLARMSAAIAIVVWCSSAASAQYFGRNKVQYKEFDFKVLETEHFDVY